MTNSISTSITPVATLTQEEYNDFLESRYRIDADNYNPIDESVPDNGPTKDFKAASAMYEVIARLKDVSDIFTLEMEVLHDEDASRTRHQAAIRRIEKYVMPMIAIARNVIKDGADRFNPKAVGTKAQSRADVALMKELVELGDYKTAASEVSILLYNYLERKGQLKRKRKTDNVTERVTRQKLKETEESKDLPIPMNEKEYGIGEFIDLVLTTTVAGKERGDLIKAIMDKKYVTRAKTTCYKVLKNFRHGTIYTMDQKWNTHGRQQIWNEEDIEDYAKWVKSRQGIKHTLADLNNALVQSLIKRGSTMSPDTKLCHATLAMYDNLVSKVPGISLCSKSIAKSNGRWTAEHSNIGTMAFIVIIAATHFYPVECDFEEIEKELEKELVEMDKDAREMYDMVKKFYKGKSIRVRDPALIINQDDTTDYFCLGTQEENRTNETGIVGTARLADSHTHSTHHHEDSHKFNGMRCKRTLLINARGDCAAPCYTLPGLTEKEMPDLAIDFIALRIEGLCIGGHGHGLQNGHGWLLLMRNTPGAEKKRFKWIRNVLLKEFIEWIWLSYFQFDSSSGAPIPEELKAVFWADGDTSQLACTTSPEGIEWFSEMSVIACKHNAAGTGKEQSADLGNGFSLAKYKNKKTTVQDILPKNHLLKRALTNELKRLSDGKLFHHQKHAAIVDHISKQPVVLAKSTFLENIIKGYIKNGMLDPVHRQYPVLKKIIATCKKIPLPEDLQRYYSAFDALLDFTVNNDGQHIPDDVFMSYGFPADIDAYGTTVIREATISQENQQHAKILTAAAEVKKRAEREMEIELSIQRKEDRKQAHVDNMLNVQLAVVEKLCISAGKEPTDEGNICECSIENFSRLKKNELHAFILDRHPTFTKTSELNHLLHPSAKKALADATNGIENALSVAFALRESPSKVLVRSVCADARNDDDTSVTESDDTLSLLIVDVLLRPELHGVVKPSDILLDSAKIQLIREAFDPDHNTSSLSSLDFFSPTSQILQQADCLFTLLKARLRTHVRTRVMPDQWNNKCLHWAKKNLALVTAYMILFDHVVPDVTCLDESCCLLKQPSCNNFLTFSNEESTRVGCYLHFNRNLSEWVRSGSAAGVGGFGQRLEQHKKRAESDTNPDNSQFYDNYPSVESVRSRSKSKRGLFEHLDPYVGASFRKDISPEIFSSRGEDGLFLHSPEEVGWINNLHCHGKPIYQKYQQMVAYLFELGYDLAISRINNVSNSPGFEGCGLIQHKK